VPKLCTEELCTVARAAAALSIRGNGIWTLPAIATYTSAFYFTPAERATMLCKLAGPEAPPLPKALVDMSKATALHAAHDACTPHDLADVFAASGALLSQCNGRYLVHLETCVAACAAVLAHAAILAAGAFRADDTPHKPPLTYAPLVLQCLQLEWNWNKGLLLR
jgi:hypothetical protein